MVDRQVPCLRTTARRGRQHSSSNFRSTMRGALGMELPHTIRSQRRAVKRAYISRLFQRAARSWSNAYASCARPLSQAQTPHMASAAVTTCTFLGSARLRHAPKLHLRDNSVRMIANSASMTNASREASTNRVCFSSKNVVTWRPVCTPRYDAIDRRLLPTARASLFL